MASSSGKRPVDASPIGATLDGRYEIQSCLGAGGMGVVYKARQAQLDRVVAIKMPHASTLANPTWRSRFEREARAMARFSHENIVQVFDFNINTDRPYIVLEFVQGQELADFLARPDKMSMAGLMYVLRQIAKGLDYAHERNVIHRDIKPENIVIADARRRVKIMDFGLARFEDMSSEVTRAGYVVGTPHYMSPEQVRGKEVGPPTDIYAYAVILYCVFTGRLPFEGEGHAIMMKHASEEPPDPLTLNPFLPRSLGDALLRSLSKKPGLRHDTATEMVNDLYDSLGKRLNLSYGAMLRGDTSMGDFPREFWIEDDRARSANDPSTASNAASTTSVRDLKGDSIYVAAPGRKDGALGDALKAAGFAPEIYPSGMAVLEKILRRPPQMLVVGDGLDDIGASSVCRLLQAHPLTANMPVIYIGDRGQFHAPRLAGDGRVEILPPSERDESIAEFARKLLDLARNAPTRPLDKIDRKQLDSPLLSFLTRLDESLVAQEANAVVTRALVRGDDVGPVFHSLAEAFRAHIDFTHQFCAILPEEQGEQGTLLLDMNDPANPVAASYVSRPIARELRLASKEHKDFPTNFRCHFAKERVPGGGIVGGSGTHQTTVPLGQQFYIVPVEEGPRLFGLYGFAHNGARPSGESAEAVNRLAGQAFTALKSAWNKRLLALARDRDDATGTWRRRKIMEYFELSLRSTPALEEPFALMVLDIDKLDSFNETFGLEGGDYVLGKVGRVLEENCSGLARAGRVGNDEFMVVLPKITSGEAMKFGRGLIQKISEIQFEQWSNSLPLTACAGLAFRAMEEKSSSYLVRAARNALMSAKAAGCGKIRAAG